MAQCIHVDPETGKECRRQAMVLSGDHLCFDHSPTISDETKRESKRKGGRSSRKVKLIDVGEVGEIENVVDLKRFLNSLLQWLVEGKVTPTQARALVGVGNALRDCLALELFELIERLDQVEAQVDTLKGGKQWQLLDEPLPNDSDESSD